MKYQQLFLICNLKKCHVWVFYGILNLLLKKLYLEFTVGKTIIIKIVKSIIFSDFIEHTKCYF